MEPILDKVLEKRGIKDLTELSQEERETFEQWNKTLAEGEMTVEKIAGFCKMQIALIESGWRSEIAKQSPQTTEKQVIFHTIYSTLVQLVEAPKASREALVKYLTGIINTSSP